MASFNQVTLLGHVTRTPESRFTPQGTQILEFGLAINRKFSVNGEKREEVTFVDITLWSKLAEVAQKYLSKGSQVLIAGHLKQDTWEDRQTGQKRSKLSVVGETLQFVGPRPTETSNSPQRQAAPPARATAPAGKSQPSPDPDFPPDFA